MMPQRPSLPHIFTLAQHKERVVVTSTTLDGATVTV